MKKNDESRIVAMIDEEYDKFHDCAFYSITSYAKYTVHVSFIITEQKIPLSI